MSNAFFSKAMQISPNDYSLLFLIKGGIELVFSVLGQRFQP